MEKPEIRINPPKGEQPSSGHVTPLIPPVQAEGALILCLSDDVLVAMRETVPTLRQSGFRVELYEAAGRDIFEIVKRPYQMIVLDINSGDGPGCQFCERWREKIDLPIIFVLHGAARNSVLRVFQAGADAYVLAPFDERELTARVGALLRRQGPTRRVS